jgi:aminopeptidase N
MALEALRQRIGGAAFLDVLGTWASEHAYLNADTADFIALAEERSGQQLDDLFQKYLYKQGKP